MLRECYNVLAILPLGAANVNLLFLHFRLVDKAFELLIHLLDCFLAAVLNFFGLVGLLFLNIQLFLCNLGLRNNFGDAWTLHIFHLVCFEVECTSRGCLRWMKGGRHEMIRSGREGLVLCSLIALEAYERILPYDVRLVHRRRHQAALLMVECLIRAAVLHDLLNHLSLLFLHGRVFQYFLRKHYPLLGVEVILRL